MSEFKNEKTNHLKDAYFYLKKKQYEKMMKSMLYLDQNEMHNFLSHICEKENVKAIQTILRTESYIYELEMGYKHFMENKFFATQLLIANNDLCAYIKDDLFDQQCDGAGYFYCKDFEQVFRPTMKYADLMAVVDAILTNYKTFRGLCGDENECILMILSTAFATNNMNLFRKIVDNFSFKDLDSSTYDTMNKFFHKEYKTIPVEMSDLFALKYIKDIRRTFWYGYDHYTIEEIHHLKQLGFKFDHMSKDLQQKYDDFFASKKAESLGNFMTQFE